MDGLDFFLRSFNFEDRGGNAGHERAERIRTMPLLHGEVTNVEADERQKTHPDMCPNSI